MDILKISRTCEDNKKFQKKKRKINKKRKQIC